MKLTVGQLRRVIQEAMVSELGPGMSVKIEKDGRNLSIHLKEAGKPKAHWPGVIDLQRCSLPDGVVWEVVNSTAHKGYGPLLYDLAMEVVVGRIGDLGIMCDRTSVSGEARRVWEHYFAHREDVGHDPLPEENFPGSLARPEALKQYYYKFDTSRLDGFEAAGLVESEGL